MEQVENIKILRKDGSQEYLDPRTQKEPACTLSLMMMVLDNPQRGEKPDGSPLLGYGGLEDFQKATRIHEKLRDIAKMGKKAGILGVANFEMEDGDLEFVTSQVKEYKPFFTSLQWAPFINQLIPDTSKEAKKDNK